MDDIPYIMFVYRMLYWTDDSDTSPGIYRSSVDRPAREPVVTDNIIKPNALAIDFTGMNEWKIYIARLKAYKCMFNLTRLDKN